MKRLLSAAGLLIGSVALALTITPAASATSQPSAVEAGSTITQRNGHVNIVVTPPYVSPPKSYGPFASPWPWMLWN